MTESPVVYRDIPSPVGRLRILATSQNLIGIRFERSRDPEPAGARPAADSSLLDLACAQLDEYFQGRRREFTVPLHPQGTEFQQRVWRRLLGIGYGETTTYGALARELGDPQASRAVGLANGRNPIPILIPCHRVIGAQGELTGFGGGLPVKQALLELERGSRQGRLF